MIRARPFLAHAEGLPPRKRRKSIERMLQGRLDSTMSQIRRLQYCAVDRRSDKPFLDATDRP